MIHATLSDHHATPSISVKGDSMPMEIFVNQNRHEGRCSTLRPAYCEGGYDKLGPFTIRVEGHQHDGGTTIAGASTCGRTYMLRCRLWYVIWKDVMGVAHHRSVWIKDDSSGPAPNSPRRAQRHYKLDHAGPS